MRGKQQTRAESRRCAGRYGPAGVLGLALALLLALAATVTPTPAAAAAGPGNDFRLQRTLPAAALKAETPALILANDMAAAAQERAAADRRAGIDPRSIDLIVDYQSTRSFSRDRGTPPPPAEPAVETGGGPTPEIVTFGSLTLNLYWLSQDERDWLADLLRRAYPVMVDVYGPPAAPLTITVFRIESLPYAGMYAPLGDVLVVRSFTPDIVIHELLHAFRDDLMSTVPAYEDGMARAAEVAVFGRLGIAFWDSDHTYVYDRMYAAHNQDTLLGSSGAFVTGYGPMALLRYQTAGMAWGKALIADPAVLRSFNEKYNRLAAADPSLRGDLLGQLALFAQVTGQIEGRPGKVWAEAQQPLHPTGGAGLQIHADVTGDTLTVRLYNRAADGSETAAPGTVQVTAGGISTWTRPLVTNALGVGSMPLGTSGQGRIELTLQAATSAGSATRVLRAYAGRGQGLYGIVAESGHPTTGTIRAEFTPAGGGAELVFTTSLLDGAFSIPELADKAGTVRLEIAFAGETARWESWVIKGKGDTYAALTDLQPAQDRRAPVLKVSKLRTRLLGDRGPQILAVYQTDEPAVVAADVRPSAQTFTGGQSPAVPAVPLAAQGGTLMWDGRDAAGQPLPAGFYTVSVVATDLAGNSSPPVTFRVLLAWSS